MRPTAVLTILLSLPFRLPKTLQMETFEMTLRTYPPAVSVVALLGALALMSPGWATAQTLSRPAEASTVTPRQMTFSDRMGDAVGVLVIPLGGSEELTTRGAGLDDATRQAAERALGSAV